MKDTQELKTVTGVVKWFDPARAFGFVVADSGGPDILLHANVLRNFGQSTVADASRLTLTIQQTSRGVQAVEVLSIEPPRPVDGAVLEDFALFDAADLKSVPLQPARVKWFDKSKGFGFANVFGEAEDIFLHIEVLRASGLSDLSPGEALAIRVVEGRRGLMASDMQQWDAALRADGEE